MTMPEDPSTPLRDWAVGVYETYTELQTAGFTARQAFDITLAGVSEGWFDEWTPFGPVEARTGDDEDGAE